MRYLVSHAAADVPKSPAGIDDDLSLEDALALRAQAMSFDEANVGAVAFSRSGDPNIGEFDDAVILKTFGQVPEDFTDSQPA
jgi:hypothetical protein